MLALHFVKLFVCSFFPLSHPSPPPPQYQQLAVQKKLQHSMDAGGGGMGGAWGSPMATSTQNRGAGYGGGRQTDSGLNRLQQQVQDLPLALIMLDTCIPL